MLDVVCELISRNAYESRICFFFLKFVVSCSFGFSFY